MHVSVNSLKAFLRDALSSSIISNWWFCMWLCIHQPSFDNLSSSNSCLRPPHYFGKIYAVLVQFAQIFWCAFVKALFEIVIRDNSGSINFQISFLYRTPRDMLARLFSGGCRLSMRSLGVSFVVCPSDEDSELAPTEKIVDMSLHKYCLCSIVSAGSRSTFCVEIYRITKAL